MSRSAFVGNIIAMLEDAGFAVSDRCAIRPRSFDLVARRGDELILVKVLRNVDAFSAESGHEMRRIGAYLDATPLVIGLRTRDEELRPEVVYFRHGVPVLSPDTAMDLFVEEIPPLIYAAPGGLYVNLDSEILADEREERGWSLGQLAKELGVSRRTVSKYESGMDASIEVAMALEDLFEAPVATPIGILTDEEYPVPRDEEAIEESRPDVEDSDAVSMLIDVGYDVYQTIRAPFMAVGEDERDVILIGHSDLTETALKRARLMGSVGAVAETPAAYFVGATSRDSVGNTALIENEEADDIDHRDEFRELVRRRSDA